MVRKWSYINKFLFLQSNSSTLNFKVVPQFKFKIFRNNTRFKAYNLGYTSFTRIQPALQKRRSTLKNYLILSSCWVKPLLNYKKVVCFIQTKSLFPISIPYSYINFFKKNIIPFKKVGLGQVNLNYSKLKKSHYSKFFLNKSRYTSKNLNLFKYTSSIQLKSYKSILSLKKSGFLLTCVSYNHFFYQTSNDIKKLHTLNNFIVTNNYLPVTSITVSIVSTLKLLFIFITLFRVVVKDCKH